MTTKYESVLSNADRVNLIREHTDIESLVTDTEQATLAKLQPQLDAVGAGGVSSREKHGFTHCIFHGDAPYGYSSWEQWINTPVKTNVFIRDATVNDWENAGSSRRSSPAVSLGGQPFRKQPKNTEKSPCINTQYGDFKKWCDDNPGFDLDARLHTHSGRLGDGGYISDEKTRIAFSAYRAATKSIPAGYKLVPIEPSAEQINAMRTGSHKDWPSDELCRVRYAAMLSASPTPDIKDSLTAESQELRIVFSGESPNLTFVEVENEDGFSVNVGQWHKRFDGYTELRIKTGNTE